MLKKILSASDCAKCRICCIFDKYDVWETPVISDELRRRITAVRDDLKFVTKGSEGAYIFNMESTWDDNEEIFRCPALDPESGCTLGDNKPFDCRIWPYRIMELGGKRVITIASICPEMYSKPLDKLVSQLEDGLADMIFEEASKNPAIVKPYEHGYPVLMVEKD